MLSAIVSSRENCDQLPCCKPLEPVHNTLMCSYDQAQLVLLQELLDSVRSEFDDVTSASWISDSVLLDAQLSITISGIRPQDIDNELLFGSLDFMDDFQGSLELINIVQVGQC